MRSKLLPLLGLLLLPLGLFGQFEAADSFDEVARKAAAPTPANQTTAADDTPAKNKQEFDRIYLDVLRRALTATDEHDPNFWQNAYILVFGDRTNDQAGAAEAGKLFDGTSAPRIFYTPTSKDNPAFVPGPEGDRMVQELNAAIEAFNRLEQPAKADYAALFAKMAPFLQTMQTAEIAQQGGIVIPPGFELEYTASAYCLQHNLPAPSVGDDMWLVPTIALIPPGAIPLFEALVKYSESHPQDRGIVQSLLWAIRESDEKKYTALTGDQKRVLNAAMDHGVDKFLEFMGVPTPGKTDTVVPPRGGSDAFGSADAVDFDGNAQQQKRLAELEALKRLIAESNRRNAEIVPVPYDPTDPRNVEALMRLLQEEAAKRKQSGKEPKPTPNDGFSKLAPNVGAKTTTPQPGVNRTTVRNNSKAPFVFDPKKYVAMTRAKRQPFAFTSPDPDRHIDWVAADRAAAAEYNRANGALKVRYNKAVHAPNPLWDIMQRDSNGILVCQLIGYGRVPGEPGNVRQPANSIIATVLLFARDGVTIPAQWNCFSNSPEYDTNCHGYTLTGGEYTIGNEHMQLFLSKESQLPVVASAAPGDVIVLRSRTGAVGHSLIAMEGDRVREAAGVVVWDATGAELNLRHSENDPFIRTDGRPAALPVKKVHETTRAEVLRTWSSPGLNCPVAEYRHPQPRKD